MTTQQRIRLDSTRQHMVTMRCRLCVCVMALCFSSHALGQNTPQSNGDVNALQLNFPSNVALNILVDYVSHRLQLNIVYDQQIAREKITIRAPKTIHEDALLGLLESILKMKGYALVDSEQAGWKRIVKDSELVKVAKPSDALNPVRTSDHAAVTHVFRLQHAEVKEADRLLRSFLSAKSANTIALDDQKILIVTDYAGNLPRLQWMISLLDQAKTAPENIVAFQPVAHTEASSIASEVKRVLDSKARADGREKTSPTSAEILADGRMNRLVLIGTSKQVEEAKALVSEMDVPLKVQTRIYRFESADATRVDRLAKELIGPVAAKTRYRSTIDREAGMLVVRAPATIHETIASLKTELDVPLTESQNPIRFYKLANTTAADVLATISAIDGGVEMSSLDVSSIKKPADSRDVGEAMSGLQEGTELTRSIEYRDGVKPKSSIFADGASSALRTVKTTKATVTADENTNTIIVVAEPATQRVYERLIRELDKRRPQVLVECIVVTMDTSDGYSLGVEISRRNAFEEGDTLTFSSFGLSTVDAATGSLSLLPGLGFNGALVSPDIADIIGRALKTNGRTKVVSAPRILVNDNASGTLASINEAPFTTTTAQQTTDAVTFGGYASAGTTISVTPHIAEGDHLQLEYSIDLNSFTGEGNNGVPPPRQTDTIASEVTIPDGHTIIVGGLKRKDYSETVQRIPILGELPVIEHLFSNRSENESDISLFVFIKPVILRDDRFADLRYLSERDLAQAGLPSDYPGSDPLMMH